MDHKSTGPSAHSRMSITDLHKIQSSFQRAICPQSADKIVSSPDPTLEEEKGLVNLGRILARSCAEEFPCANEIVALAQSYDKLTAGMQHRYTICIAIQFHRPIRFKICFTVGCGHAITCKRSHSDQSESSFAWRYQHICACAVE